MNNTVKKMVVVVVSIVSLSLIALADEGQLTGGSQVVGDYDLSQCGGSGDGSCTYATWTSYVCVGGTSAPCTPYSTQHVPHSGSCTWISGFGYTCE